VRSVQGVIVLSYLKNNISSELEQIYLDYTWNRR
jgi:hypothetical protein